MQARAKFEAEAPTTAYNGWWVLRGEVAMKLSARVVILEANLANWRAAGERRRQLEHDVSCFVTPAERQDLLATLDRYPDAATWEIRELLIRGAMQQHRVQAWPAIRPVDRPRS